MKAPRPDGPLDERKREKVKFCTECGAPISESNKFCANCGARLNASDSPSPTINSIPEAPAEPESPKPPVKDTSGLPPAWMPPPVQPGTGMTIESSSSSGSNADDEDEGAAPIPPPPSFMPMPVKTTFGGDPTDRPGGLAGVDDDWKMSDLGPPPPPKRRLWLWIPLGVIAAVILCCITFVILSETILEDTFDNWATQVATDSTEEAVEP